MAGVLYSAKKGKKYRRMMWCFRSLAVGRPRPGLPSELYRSRTVELAHDIRMAK
jgi:hypothetical protein